MVITSAKRPCFHPSLLFGRSVSFFLGRATSKPLNFKTSQYIPRQYHQQLHPWFIWPSLPFKVRTPMLDCFFLDFSTIIPQTLTNRLTIFLSELIVLQLGTGAFNKQNTVWQYPQHPQQQFSPMILSILTHSHESFRAKLWSEKMVPSTHPCLYAKNFLMCMIQSLANESNKHKVMLCSVIFARWLILNGKKQYYFSTKPI